MLGISVKRQTTLKNVLALPLIFAINSASGAYYNTQQVSLLEDSTRFNVSHSDIGTVEGRILFWGSLVPLLISVSAGYTFDLFGRKALITLSCVLIVSSIVSLPLMPTIEWLIVNRVAASVGYQYLNSHPLIIDYIKSESRGKATSLQSLGTGFGEFIAMTVLLTFQLRFSPVVSSVLAGIVVMTMGYTCLSMLREPVLKTIKSSTTKGYSDHLQDEEQLYLINLSTKSERGNTDYQAQQ